MGALPKRPKFSQIQFRPWKMGAEHMAECARLIHDNETISITVPIRKKVGMDENALIQNGQKYRETATSKKQAPSKKCHKTHPKGSLHWNTGKSVEWQMLTAVLLCLAMSVSRPLKRWVVWPWIVTSWQCIQARSSSCIWTLMEKLGLKLTQSHSQNAAQWWPCTPAFLNFYNWKISQQLFLIVTSIQVGMPIWCSWKLRLSQEWRQIKI